MDGVLLAVVGLKRLGIGHEAGLILETDVMLPSAGQGAVGIEILDNSRKVMSIFDQVTCSRTLLCVNTERMALAVLDGSCHTPIGCYATLEQGVMSLCLQVASMDGQIGFCETASEPVSDVKGAENFGRKLGGILKEKLPAGFLQ